MANSYDISDLVRTTGTFTVGGVATDPTTIALKVQDPSGNEATYTYALAQVTKSGTGVYYKDITLDEYGIWFCNWVGTGSVQSGGEDYFTVRKSEF